MFFPGAVDPLHPFFFDQRLSSMLTDEEKNLVRQFNNRQALLEPFRRVMDDWSVEYKEAAQSKIAELQLEATGELEKDWTIRVRAGDTGIVVAEFTFPEYGRLFDMRKVNYDKSPPADVIEEWVTHKVQQGRIKYSTYAQKNNLAFTDPKVIHDLTFRFLNAGPFKIKRRRWYNKEKLASVNELYDQLQEVMQDVVLRSAHHDMETPSPVTS